jgi:hypothetical protein
MALYFGEKGVVHHLTARCSSEQIGVAKRLNWTCSLKEHQQCSLSWPLSIEMWAKVLVTANYIRNCVQMSAHGKTSWDACYGEKAKVSQPHEGVYCLGLHARARGLRHKLEPMSEKN